MSLSCAQLDLRDNYLSPEGAKALAPALAASASLTNLDLYNNSLKDEGVKVICEALQSNKETKLASLNVGFNDVGIVGAKAVAAMAAVVASMTSLDVCDNSLGEEGKAVLRTAVEGRSKFELKL